jgi:hypothetical protein
MSDTVLGTTILVMFLALVFAAGKVLYRIKNAALAREWAPLRPSIENARVVGDEGGGATSWLTGTYRGRRITASISPDVSSYTGTDGSGHYRNAFSVALEDVPGARDWRLAPAPWSSGSQCDVVASDETLRAALAASTATSILSRLGAGEVDFSKSARALRFSEDVRPLKVPPPERFRAALDALMELADVNAAVNVSKT